MSLKTFKTFKCSHKRYFKEGRKKPSVGILSNEKSIDENGYASKPHRRYWLACTEEKRNDEKRREMKRREMKRREEE